ncbi:MAG TPA: Gfo/Idh/MocA family oxidoreductase, partial [Candidatus Acidoferrum sp.]|nr:Gfo/Idh/MocA family oxidoreductase [Candidatus Acidoferrum sp.]
MNAVAANNNRIRVAVVGAGEFGRNHARVYRELPGAELVGIYDKNQERAAQIAAEFQTKAFASLEDLRGQVDAVSVAVPT